MATSAVTAPRWLTADEQRAWRAYLDMNARLAARLNRQLQDEFGLSIADFSVLVQLSEHVDARMRVLELARALRWEKSRLSHQLSRMQQRGLVERSNCTEDRRGAFIRLTERGRSAVEEAAPRHVEAVRQYLFDGLSAAQVEALAAIARTVIDRLDAAGPPDLDTCGAAGAAEASPESCG
jgi:DNA-binding MarR family transcriptional regulator